MKDDVEHSAAVGHKKEGHHRPLGVNVAFPVLRDSNEHERDRELDGQDRCAVEDLEEEEVHQAECLVTLVSRFLKVLGVHADAVDGSKNATDREDGEGDLGPRTSVAHHGMGVPACHITHSCEGHDPILACPRLPMANPNSKSIGHISEYHQSDNAS